jgi:hypothetical protein
MRRALLLATIVMLAGCGGDGGGMGGSPTGSGPAPAPTPSPSPTPTPSPSPTPTPTPSPTGLRFVSESSGPLVGRFDSYENADLNASGGIAQNVTDYDGVYTYPGTSGSLPGGGQATASFSAAITAANYTSVAFGVDRPTRVILRNTAPPGATVISPMTSFIRLIGSVDATLAAFQLDAGGSFAPSNPISFTTYSATQNLAANPTPATDVIAANLRALALSQVFAALRGTPGASEPIPDRPSDSSAEIAAYIRSHPDLRLFTDAGTEEMLRAAAPASGTYATDTYRAAAHLVNIYAEATRRIGNHTGWGPRFMLGLQGFLWMHMLDLREANDAAAAARIMKLDTTDVDDALLGFVSMPAFPTKLFFPSPDFIRAAPGSTVKIYPDDPGASDSSIPRRSAYGTNDLYYDGKIDFGRDPAAVATAVNVPPDYWGLVTPTLNSDGSITINVTANTPRTVAFDYTTRTSKGLQETARIYVIVR